MVDEAAVRKMIDAMGGVKKLRQEMQEFEELCNAFQAHHGELVKQYPDQWIGMYRDKIIVAKELEELIAKMREAGIPPGRGLVEFLETNPIPWVL